ncbi:ATP-binding protein [Streptomyces sp. NPDC059861]|uniref:ATP-binding protein n=1 Tax=Streptomyces sp. NPDC059861 TaxID=3346974 RepID=UPI00365A3148
MDMQPSATEAHGTPPRRGVLVTDLPASGQHGAQATEPRPGHRQALLALPSQHACVAAARRWTTSLLTCWRLPEHERDSAVLIVSELTANAAQHGHAHMTLLLGLVRDTLHIAVTDSGPARPGLRAQTDPDEHGRGTAIVRSLALWSETRQSARGREVRVGLPVTTTATANAG